MRLQLSRNADEVLRARYLKQDKNGNIVETPEELFDRVARAIAEAELAWGNSSDVEEWHEHFLEMLLSLDFLPNSPTLMNAGSELGQLSACFVLPVEDSIEQIFDSIKQMALIQRSGGGTGFSFSHLRAKGALLTSIDGSASGPVSFMKIFDSATENIKQGGKRRGANMGILRVDHPDILEFITVKQDGISLQNFNLSVGVTNRFLRAVTKNQSYDLIDPRTKRRVKSISAKKVFDQIVKNAWKTGDPGLIFLDAINQANTTPHLGMIEATNPCGESPLLAYEACNLGSINLSHMVCRMKNKTAIDEEKLRSITQKAIRFLDNVIEVNHYPLPEIAKITQGNRKIGLGVMGFAEMLIQLGISYHSKRAIEVAEKTMKIIAEESRKSSRMLAEERGVFPHWKGSIYESKKIMLRNATLNAIAPTGTLSIIAGTSAGIEPLFALAYERHVLGGKILFEMNPVFFKYLEEKGVKTAALIKKIKMKGNLIKDSALSKKNRELFITALEIPFQQHLKVQAAFQRYIDNSVSKTINLPAQATSQEVCHAYLQAWKLGLKGITLYRYNSKSSQVLQLGIRKTAFSYEDSPRCGRGEC